MKRLLLAVLLLASPAFAAVDPATLKGVDLLPGGVLSLKVGNDASLGTATAVTADASTGSGQALRLETLKEAANPWDVQASAKIAAAVSKDDVCLASFWIRTQGSRLESGEAETQFVFELAKDPWEKSAEYPVRAGKEWRQIFVPFQAKASYPTGGAQMIFRMGYRPQAFEVAGMQVRDFGSQVKLGDLPVTKLSYQGREADAPWRKEAQARIEALRMAPLSIKVVDAQGRPVPGALVNVHQVRSAFYFGSALSGHYLFREKQAAGKTRYEAELKRLFNITVEENAFKWPSLAGDWGSEMGMSLALESANWAKENGLAFRAHNLYWPSWRNSPKGLRSYEKDPEGLRRELLEHVRATVTTAKGLVTYWDVVNEPFDNHELSDILGAKSLGEAFREAHLADPAAKLYINDYAILAGGGGDTPHRQHYRQVIEGLLRGGAPLQGIGLQGHFGWNLTGMDDAKAILDQYAALLPHLSITEYDISVDDLDLAGDYTRDLLTLFFSHPAAEAFLMWGFWDGAHWGGNAPLFKKDWTPKPALQVWEDLVLKQWRTNANGMTSQDGAYNLRAFKGDYEVIVSLAGKRTGFKLQLLKPEGKTVDVTLK